MGFDYTSGEKSIEIPLYYVYNDIAIDVYHVSNANADPRGNDHYLCGYLDIPCVTINKALLRNPDANTKKVGIVSGF
jgi:hypothetical protein